jgi:hypothetical protein
LPSGETHYTDAAESILLDLDLPSLTRNALQRMTTIAAEPRVSASALRVRRHRERRRANLHLFTVVVPETNIQNAISRHLLRVEHRAKALPAIQGYYAAQLSNAALDWLINGGVITREQRGDAAASSTTSAIGWRGRQHH